MKVMNKKAGLGKGLFLFLAIILVFGFGLIQKASATPLFGQPIYYEGGSVQVTVLPHEAYYTDKLYLFSTTTPLLIALNSEVGKIVNLTNLPSLGVAVGDELLFGIVVANTGDTFVTGPASRNLDNFAHVSVDYFDNPSGDTALLSFEDIFGGGDQDFNDAVFQVSGGVGLTPPIKITAVPEPASVILLLFGLAGVVLVSARKKNHC